MLSLGIKYAIRDLIACGTYVQSLFVLNCFMGHELS